MFKLASVSISVPLATGLSWSGGGGWIFEEKIDGVRAAICDGEIFGRSQSLNLLAPASLNTCRIDGEWDGNAYHAFDILTAHGEDVSMQPLRIRRSVLDDVLRSVDCPWIVPIQSGSGGEFLEAVLARGGEGIVAKHLDSFYGESESWVKCKRQDTYDCIVTEVHPAKQSVRLSLNGEDAGWCAVIGRKFSTVKVGGCVEVACHSIHPSGKLREPRFIRLRTDKD